MKKILMSYLLFSAVAFSAESKQTATISTAAYPEVADVRCEKLSGHTLSEFKAKLVANCDLNKPFSSSLNRILNEETYFYCCQLRK